MISTRNDITITREGLVKANPERGIRTRVVIEDGHYIIRTEEDYTGLLENNHELNCAGINRTFGAGHHVASMPATLYHKKVKEFRGGFDSQDPEVKGKWTKFLNSNEFRALRVSQGKL